jgi:hypothetical protein
VANLRARRTRARLRPRASPSFVASTSASRLPRLLAHRPAMAEPTKADTDAVFKILKAQKANKVGRSRATASGTEGRLTEGTDRCASTARPGIRLGQASLMVYTYVSSARACTGTWACTSLSFGARVSLLFNSGADLVPSLSSPPRTLHYLLTSTTILILKLDEPRFLAVEPAPDDEGRG